MVASSTAPAPPAPNSAAGPSSYRFSAGARERFAGTFKDQSLTPGGSAQNYDLVDLAAGDYTAGVYLQVSCATSANAATVAFTGDAPFNAIQEVQLLDPQGVPFQIYSGYELALIDGAGGYTGQADPTQGPYYTAVTGAGGTGGSFTFFLRIPAEVFPRDGVGALYNGSTAAQFRIRVILAPSATIYSTPPTTLAPVRLRVNTHGYVVPMTASPNGVPYASEPPGGAVYQNWTKQVYQIGGAGFITVPFTRKGFFMRQVLFVVRDNSGVRSNTVLAGGDFRLIVDNVDVFNGTPDLWRHVMWERNRYAAGATALPTGVYQQSWCHDWDGLVGGETRDMWVPTQPGSIIELRATAAAAGSVTILVNDIAPTQQAIATGIIKG